MADWIVNQRDVDVEHQVWHWEDQTYERYRQHLSVVLGNTPDAPHPFDVELTRVPPGARPCPVHAHKERWEFFIVVEGRASIERDGEEVEVGQGACFMQPAGTRHRIRNASNVDDLVFYVIANEVEDETTERVRV